MEKKETQITTLEEEKRLMIWLGIAGGAVLLLALATFFFLWRWTVQKKRLAESQKELAEQQVKQLEQEKQLIATQAVLDGEVQERIRIAHELINNALKHSGASHILMQIVQEADRLALTVEDNGKGFNSEVITAGMGLANVRIRVASFKVLVGMIYSLNYFVNLCRKIPYKYDNKHQDRKFQETGIYFVPNFRICSNHWPQ
ncbi:hypothetical protein AGMMS49574_06070 [Bacteroidia bacterium]|nr:hypothetical protein AGMMS49574_06070 [Bacteroidia bacterium]